MAKRRGESILYSELLTLPDESEVWMEYSEYYDRTPSARGVFRIKKIPKSDPPTWELEGKHTGGEFTHTGEPNEHCIDETEGTMTRLFKVKVS